jgi:hypothetical protein
MMMILQTLTKSYRIDGKKYCGNLTVLHNGSFLVANSCWPLIRNYHTRNTWSTVSAAAEAVAHMDLIFLSFLILVIGNKLRSVPSLGFCIKEVIRDTCLKGLKKALMTCSNLVTSHCIC